MTLVKIAFVLDCTASMEEWIYAAQTKIREIVETSKRDHPLAQFEVGLVAYRDYGDIARFHTMDFTTPEEVMESLQDIHAEGGDDEAEDVAHALRQVMELDWMDADLRMVFHITDAPAHGYMFHRPHVSDRFPEGDPEGLDPRTIISQMSLRGFFYSFVKITSATDTMLDMFHNSWIGEGRFRILDLRPQVFGRSRGVDMSDMLSPIVSRVVSQAIDQHTFSQDM